LFEYVGELKFVFAALSAKQIYTSWLRHRRIRLVTAYHPSVCFESFELHKILRVVRSGQFSAPEKFPTAPTTHRQSLAPLDASSWTLGPLGQRRNLERWTTVGCCFASFARAVIKRCTHFGGAVISVL